MAYITQIQKLIEKEPHLTNREVADKLGCSRRTVRRIAGNQRARLLGPTGGPKVLIFDIETAPMEIYVWGLFKQHPNIEQIKKDWCVLSWSAKWLFDSKVMSARIDAAQAFDRDDSSILEEMWNLFDEADVVIAHNAQRFDVRKLNARWMQNGDVKPSPYVVIDTLKQAKTIMAPASWKLKYLNKFLKLAEQKDDSNYGMWVRAVEGDDTAIEEMLEYNKQDVVALEELYVRIRPWMKSHPNLALYVDSTESLCPTCTSDNLQWNGYYYTPAGKYASFRCLNCGALGRSPYSSLTTDQRKALLRSTAR